MAVEIIAEAGVNHNGSLDMALQLVDAAAQAGADYVKFQTFKTEHAISKNAPKAEYQKETTGGVESQFEMVKKLELDEAAHDALSARAAERQIKFLSTPFDLDSVDLLTHRLGLRTLKIASGEITNAPLMLKIARNAERVILSSGMSTLGDIELALGVIAFGFTAAHDARPTVDAFRRSYASAEGQAALASRVTLLHCTTEYPAPMRDVNLRAMATLRRAFGLRVGYSDHTQGIAIPIAAAACGAEVIEKHFTLDCSLPGPDHRASLEPADFAAMVRGVRDVEAAMLGNGVKTPAPSEVRNISIARKSLVAARPIARGETFTEAMIAVKRPGDGVSPLLFWEWLGRTAERDYAEDEVL